MAKIPHQVLKANKVFYDEKLMSNENQHLTGEKPKKKRRFYRSKVRIYLENVYTIEEFVYDTFEDFTSSPLVTVIMDNGDHHVLEMSFKLLDNVLAKFDKNRSLIITN